MCIQVIFNYRFLQYINNERSGIVVWLETSRLCCLSNFTCSFHILHDCLLHRDQKYDMTHSSCCMCSFPCHVLPVVFGGRPSWFDWMFRREPQVDGINSRIKIDFIRRGSEVGVRYWWSVTDPEEIGFSSPRSSQFSPRGGTLLTSILNYIDFYCVTSMNKSLLIFRSSEYYRRYPWPDLNEGAATLPVTDFCEFCIRSISWTTNVAETRI